MTAINQYKAFAVGDGALTLTPEIYAAITALIDRRNFGFKQMTIYRDGMLNTTALATPGLYIIVVSPQVRNQ